MKAPFKYQVAAITVFVFLMLNSFDGTTTSTSVALRRLQQTEEINSYLVPSGKKLRLAVFGSSNAWGAALDERFKAYPFVLSPEVDNYADFSAGPNYPSVCAETIVGDDEMYDVIILDFWLKASQGLVPLAQRLRQRFPNAIMIFLKLWTPNHARRIMLRQSPEESTGEDSLEPQSLLEWKTSQEDKIMDFNGLKTALRSDTATWYFPEHTDADYYFDQAVAAVGGHTFQFPMKDDPVDTIIDYLGYFDEATHSHVSTIGHAVIAEVIHNTVTAVLDGKGQDTVDFVDSAVHRTWGKGDSCHLWFTTGATANNYDTENLAMVEYDDLHGKFALELNPNNVGWVEVFNPEDDERTLYLSFLLSVEEGVYPVVKATYIASDIGETFTVLDQSISEDAKEAVQDVHVVKTVPMKGMFSPGTTRIYLETLEQEDLPFRLVGDSITDESAVPIEIGFGPVFNV